MAASVWPSCAAREWKTGLAQNNACFGSLIDAKGSRTKWKSTHQPTAVA
jgi:hypothetical protein